jgi:DNA modification methylase
METNLIYNGDSYSVLKTNFPEKCVDLVYLDPPFSFNPKYAKLWYDKETMKMFEEMSKGSIRHFVDWLSRRVEQCHRVLKDTGSIFLHCDQKFGHYIKVELDNIFGRNNFQNEIIWAYKSGGATKKRFSRKHDNIFFYSKSNKWTFNPIKEKSYNRNFKPYKFKGVEEFEDEVGWHTLVNMKDVWNIDMVGRTSKERLGYFTQKPEALLERIIKAGSNVDDIILDPFCGCGTTIAVAYKLGRQWIGIDISSPACKVMKKRMESLDSSLNIPIIGLPLNTKDLKELDAFEFEDYICDMTNSLKTQHISDKGIDGYYLGEIPLQIKQQERVGRNVIDNFETALRRKNKNKGYVVAFSFTKGAYEEAARAKDDELDIKLVDMNELIKSDYDLEALLE